MVSKDLRIASQFDGRTDAGAGADVVDGGEIALAHHRQLLLLLHRQFALQPRRPRPFLALVVWVGSVLLLYCTCGESCRIGAFGGVKAQERRRVYIAVVAGVAARRESAAIFASKEFKCKEAPLLRRVRSGGGGRGLASPRRRVVAIRFPSAGTMRGLPAAPLMFIPFFASRTLLLLWQRLQKIAQIPERKC